MTGADIIAVIILIALAIAIVAYLLHWLYRRSSKEVSFVRTGMGGEKVVLTGGALVIPIVHNVTMVGMVGWLYVLGELYFGEASAASAASGNEHVDRAFRSLRLIVTIGWAIYPLGYFMQNLGGGVDVATLNVIYNLADFLNKLVFGFVLYQAAIESSTIVRASR